MTALSLASCGGGGSSGGGALPAPLVLQVVFAAPTAIDLGWIDAASDEDGFMVERATNQAGAPGVFVAVGQAGEDEESFQDVAVLPGASYWYQVRAVRSGALSAPSNVVFAQTPPAGTVPAAPSGLVVSQQSSSALVLSWTDNSTNEQGFHVERAADASGAPGVFAPLSSVPANLTQFADVGLSVGATYWYRVRAFDAGLASPYCAPAQGSTAPTPAGAASASSLVVAGEQNDARLVLASDGTSFVGATSGQNALVFAFGPTGALLWQREISGLWGAFELALAADGNLLLAGTAARVLAKLRRNDGAVLFANAYPFQCQFVLDDWGPNAAPKDSISIAGYSAGAIAHDGTVLASHSANFGFGLTRRQNLPDGGALYFGSLVARFDAAGAEQWERRLTGPLGEVATIAHAHRCSDGGFLLFARLMNALWVGKLSASGALVQQQAFSVATDDLDEAAWVSDSIGGLYLTFGAQNHGARVLHWDDTGALQWRVRVQSPSAAYPMGAAIRPSGGCMLLGYTSHFGGGVWVVALDGSGNLDWERVLQSSTGPALLSRLWRWTPDGGVLLTSTNNQSCYAAKLDALGNLDSQLMWSGSFFAVAYQADVLADGRWVLSGGAAAPTSYSLWSAMFDPLGALLSSARISAPPQNEVADRAVARGVRAGGALEFVYPSGWSTSADLQRVLLSGLGAPLVEGAGPCVLEHLPSPASLLLRQGVSLTNNPMTDVSATNVVFATDLNDVQPSTITPQPYQLSNFQGVAAIAPGCSD